MSAKGIERDLETAIKAKLAAEPLVADAFTYVDGVAVAKPAIFRAWLIDDDPGEDFEEKDYPCVSIKSSPAESVDGGAGLFNDVSIDVEISTHHSHDPKRTELARLYEEVRYILGGDLAGLERVGYASLILDGGGDRGIEGSKQFMNISLTAKTCGVAT